MADAKSSGGAHIAGIVLGALCVLFWIILVPNLIDLGRSDAAGNAMAQGFAAVGIVLLWGLLSILALIAAINGAMPEWARAALLIVPASALAAMVALDLLSHASMPPYRWPIATVALVPPLVVTYSLWSLTRTVSHVTAAALLGAIAAVSLAVIPMQGMRDALLMQARQESAKVRAAFEALAEGSPLWDLTAFLEARDQTIASSALTRIQKLDRRQRDAETMLERGDFPLGYLSRFELDPTPTVCERARALLRARLAPLIVSAQSKPYSAVAQDVSDAVADMSWLIGYGCDLEAETGAWEAMANAYRDPGFDVVRLGEMRKPGELGRKLREDPDKFSQLGPQSHLKAWLKFSDDDKLRGKIIAGVRTLDHRTADAVEILTDRYQANARFRLLQILPDIDLDATPALCASAAKVAGADIWRVYRPKPDDQPRPYAELLDRLGIGEPLSTVIWLAEHGCDVRTQLSDAEAAVSAYQDSPRRAAMLGTLARLRGR